MAIKLSNKPNVIAPGGDYPYGDIRNIDGTIEGTPVSREVYADFHQFFEKLMDDAGVTHNGTPDNSANGFQLMEALIDWQKLRFASSIFATFNDFFVASSNITGFKYKYPVNTQGITEISGTNGDATYDLCSLSRNVPVGHVHRLKIKNDLNGTFNFRILLNATSLGTEPPLIKRGVTASDSEYIYTNDMVITFVRTNDGWQLIEE